MSTPIELLQKVMDAVREEHQSYVKNMSPEQRRAYNIARKLCENDGYNPDDVSMGNPKQPPMMHAKGTVAIIAPLQPVWALYFNDACAAINIVEATKE